MSRLRIVHACCIAVAVACAFGASAAAAQDRTFELVTPGDDLPYTADGAWAAVSGGPQTGAGQVSTPDGRHVAWLTAAWGTLPGMAEDGGVYDIILASRGPDGWTSTSPLGHSTGIGCGAQGGAVVLRDLSDDGSTMLWDFECVLDKARFGGTYEPTQEPFDQTGSVRGSLYRIDVAADTADHQGRKYDVAGPVPRAAHNDVYLGSTPDMATVYFGSSAGLLPGLPDGAGAGALKIYRRSGGVTELLTKTHDGSPFDLAGVNPNPLDRPNSVAADGATISLTAPFSAPMVAGDDNGVTDVYQVDGDSVIWASDPQAVPEANRPAVAQTAANRFFQGSATDGERIFLSTTEQLTADDTDTALDVYMYDRRDGEGAIERVSKQDAGTCVGCDDNASSTTGISHSNANYVVNSDDGSRLFLITGDVLAEDDADGQPSLYVRDVDGGSTTYVAPAGAGVTTATNGTDAGVNTANSLVRQQAAPTASFKHRPIALTGDGRTAIFSLATNVPLPAGRGGADADGARDLFVWHEDEGLRRVRQGIGPDDNTATVPTLGCYGWGARPHCRVFSGDGVAYFDTADALDLADTDGGSTDVYGLSIASGEVDLVSAAGAAATDSRYVDNSESGDDVFFSTSEALDPTRDSDGAARDIYNARRGAAFGPLPEPDPPCLGDGCQPPPRPPGSAPPVASDRPGGTGDANPGPRTRIAVLGLTARQRTALARGRKVGLRVRSSARGRIAVRGWARIGGKRRRATAPVRAVREAGVARIALRLTPQARRALRARGRLAVRLAVRHSRLVGVRGVRVVLRTKSGRTAQIGDGGAA
ncbi:MAG: hypothetical protein GXY03_00530 [Solirubrobacterales bacterium]|nr:hypothetical protein [Solirubrobacterales bacterium]